MANNKMLIDATHPEETRVVTVHGSKVEEFDFEAANRRQLRGNIYLAKVTRVEPSLQAAFVEYGGNRHGFLAFNEIHPDYYQIPLADRQALLEDEAREAEEYREREDRRRSSRRSRGRRAEASARRDETVTAEDVFQDAEILETAPETGEAGPETVAAVDTAPSETALEPGADASAALPEAALDSAPAAEAAEPATAEAAESGTAEVAESHEAAPEAAGEDEASSEAEAHAEADAAQGEPSDEDESDEEDDEESDDDDSEDSEEDDEEGDAVEQLGGKGDALAELPERPRSHRRHYKIQEVIKRRQIILVQVVKEERGTKGAALTTYLSLAGRYSVLMPNTGRGGGISRKITSSADRKRLKEVVEDLEVPDGMGVILRTAGASRTKPEIKRDFEYLMRLWESVRELTLASTAPTLVYEEGSLIKRAIRDLYNKDLEEVLVAGEAAYAEASEFMRMLMPGQSKVVRPYRDPTPIFARYGVEQQLDAMFSTHVTLKSGGYLVINPTEALVSIDVNSGRSTREHDIEDTALRTNLEAAEEVARQLRLRDLAGLIVIDFIDMEEKRNNRAVEKKLNDCLKNDRARIQVGRISPFGLLEMSRQRIRTGLLESSSIPCAHCGGSGFVRATSSVALHILRSIEEALLKSATHNLVLRTRTEVALYILNQKRAHLRELELRFGVTVTIGADERLAATTAFQLERGDPAVRPEGPVTGVRAVAVSPAMEFEDVSEEEEVAEEGADEAEAESADERNGAGEARGEEGEGRRRRRRRRRRGERSEGSEERSAEAGASEDAEAGDDDTVSEEAEIPAEASPGEEPREGENRRRRRGRRGGRGRSEGRSREGAAESADELAAAAEEPVDAESVAEVTDAAPAPVSPLAEELPDPAPLKAEEPLPVVRPPEEPAVAIAAVPPTPAPEPVAVVLTPPSDPDRPKRAGWWSRTKAALAGD
ncbi:MULTISPECIES: ribonuclease E/G [unclassified Methylobacterium]|nr:MULTISPECIES: ribonuclease E/G [unclassified Methylobacterium]PIU15531.1 MAG: ribonuclease [Methylobacterium sp. CG08_land_8_20_14_0_20_71_15]GBU19456.1 hypothetical protein AwMethylo_36710 [Methylobacterium sp.]